MTILWVNLNKVDETLRMAHTLAGEDDETMLSWEDEVHSGYLVMVLPPYPGDDVIDAEDVTRRYPSGEDDWEAADTAVVPSLYPVWYRLWRRFVSAVMV